VLIEWRLFSQFTGAESAALESTIHQTRQACRFSGPIPARSCLNIRGIRVAAAFESRCIAVTGAPIVEDI